MNESGEIIKSGAFGKLADLIYKLAGPVSEEVGLLMADKMKAYRVQNWVKVVHKTKRILAEARLPPKAVPPRLFLPIFEASSIEDDESLQDLWAGLLASASEQCDNLSPSFVDTMKQLTPHTARMLSALFEFTQKNGSVDADDIGSALQSRDEAAVQLATDVLEKLGLVRREYMLRQEEERWPSRPQRSGEESSMIGLAHRFGITQYGVQFMKSCHGPNRRNLSRSANAR
ncbi:MAG: Abi-alpha family protein [Candidatus Sulfotelmatobacter sp.]